jgi:dihydroorotate dehydrogenase
MASATGNRREPADRVKTFLISPPFGNWIGSRHCTRVLGSFTWERRCGLIYHTIRSLRPTQGGWINQIGLRNRGIRACKFETDAIYSLVGLVDGDWQRIMYHCPTGLHVEVNLGCPNVHEYGIPFDVLRDYCALFVVGAKLPPTDDVDDIAAMCIEAGVRYLHCCNTIPTERGGESGRRLFEVNLPIVKRLAARYPGKVVAGGGIYDVASRDSYRAAGAVGFSLATVWLTPWRVRAILAG